MVDDSRLDGFTVVDVDAHQEDRLDDLFEYIDDDDPWLGKFESGFERDTGPGYVGFWPTWIYVRHEVPRDYDPFHSQEEIVHCMEELDLDTCLLLGDQMLMLGAMRGDDKRPIKYSEAYMDYMLDEIVDPEEGIYAYVPVIHSDPDAATALIERVGDEEGIVGAVVNAHADQPLGNQRYDPIYEACEKYDLPFVVHGGGEGLDYSPMKGHKTSMETHALNFLVSNMNQITSVVVQGVPEKFPDLDFVFQEAGLFYVPLMMYRLDQEYLRQPTEAPLLEKLPSEYMKEFYYATQPLEVVPDGTYFEYVLEMIGGPDRLMYASDWPHGDHDRPSEILDTFSFLGREDQAKILGKNAQEVFGL